MVRWNPNMNCLEVNDGSIWKTLEMSYATVGLNAEAESLLDWAKAKMQEEQEIETLAKDHPAVRIAKENLNKVKEELANAEKQLKATVILSKEYQTNEESAS